MRPGGNILIFLPTCMSRAGHVVCVGDYTFAAFGHTAILVTIFFCLVSLCSAAKRCSCNEGLPTQFVIVITTFAICKIK